MESRAPGHFEVGEVDSRANNQESVDRVKQTLAAEQKTRDHELVYWHTVLGRSSTSLRRTSWSADASETPLQIASEPFSLHHCKDASLGVSQTLLLLVADHISAVETFINMGDTIMTHRHSPPRSPVTGLTLAS